MADPSVACVDEEGNLTGLKNGGTELTVTLLPSGRSVSIRVMVGSAAEDCPMSAFTDLKCSAWYHDGVHWALEEGVMVGVGDGKFKPNAAVTRAQIVTMLYSLAGKPTCDAELTFQDVKPGKWYTEAIRWASSEGLVAGYSAERFAPNENATREQIVTILYKYAAYMGLAVPAAQGNPLADYTDANRVSSWAQNAFRWAVTAGIISGTSDTTLSPKKTATRAEVATMLRKLSLLPQ